jgi:hypothetical protein
MSIRTENGWQKRHGCDDCKKKFIYYDYDCGEDIYCNRDGDRPLCGSSSMDESFSGAMAKSRIDIGDDKYYEEYSRLMDYWSDWAGEHWTSEAAICDLWEL